MASIIQQLGLQLVKLGSRFVGTPLTTMGRVFSLTVPEVFTAIGVRNAIEQGFDSNLPVYVVVKKTAKKFGAIPRYLYDAKKTERKAMHPLRESKAYTPFTGSSDLIKLLERPNKYYSQDYFYSLVMAYYMVCGEAFIWLNRGALPLNADGSIDDFKADRLPVLEMYVLPTQLVTAIPDPEDLWGVLGWILEGGERFAMRRQDVIHWKDINLDFDVSSRTQLRGMSPLTPGAKTVAESSELAKSSLRTAQNDGAKAIIYEKTLNAKMTPTQQTQLEKVIDTRINNNDRSGAVATLQGDWGLLNLAADNRAQQFIERKKMTIREIALLFGAPPELFDTETKYDNMGKAILQWLTDCIIPACKQLDGEFNRVILKAFKLEGLAFIGSDWSELPEIREAMVAAAKILQDIWSVTPNEVRQTLGYEDWADTEFNEPWVTSGRTPLSRQQKEEDMMNQVNELANAAGAANNF